jgi:hypothetical protein
VWVDDILAPHLRDWMYAKPIDQRGWFKRWFGKVIECPWCVAPYLATPMTAITFWVSGSLATLEGCWYAALTTAAVSMAASWLAERSYA